MTACSTRGEVEAHKWELSGTGQLRHLRTGLCLDRGSGTPGEELYMTACSKGSRHEWYFDHYADDHQDLKLVLPALA